MRVLIAGGVKTQNIVDGLERKFGDIGMEFITVEYIEDIQAVFSRGEYFDRALIIEQCWNFDFTDMDEISIRKRINNFAKFEADRGIESKISYVFLVQTEGAGLIVSEEILPIKNDSIVVIKAPKYSVNFFASLVTCELDKFPSDIVYRHKKVENTNNGIKSVGETDKKIYGDDILELIEELGSEDSVEEIDADTSIVGIDSKEEDIEADSMEDEEESDIISQLDNIEEDVNILKVSEGDDGEDQELVDDLFEDIGAEWVDVKDGGIREKGVEVVTDLEMDNEDGHGVDVSDEVGAGFKDDMYEDEVEVPEGSEENTDVDERTTHDEDIEFEVEDGNIGIRQQGPKRKRFIGRLFSSKSKGIQDNVGGVDKDIVKSTIEAFALRGNSIVVTGCGGCGTSTIAYNLANTIANIGYTVLLVDMDTRGRTQSYISRHNYRSIEPDGSNLMVAINSSVGINTHVSIVKHGFRLLSMGLAGDIVNLENITDKKKLMRFVNLAKTNHNFVIYDIPFLDAVGAVSEVTFLADNVVVVVDSSNWGITKTMLNMCNIELDDMTDIIFSRGQILYNNYRGLDTIMGEKVSDISDVSTIVDDMVQKLIGHDTGYYFRGMSICGVINYDEEFEKGWYADKQYSDSDVGRDIFTELLRNIMLKR